MDTLEKGLGNINRCSAPSDLRITDIRVAKIQGAPMDCIMVKILTNSELVGYGEIRDWSSETYGLMLKSKIIGENPCNIDKIFRRIKQFGGHSRQGGGVSGIEALLAAQSVGDALQDGAKKRRAAAHGNDILDKLEDLRAAILAGVVSKSKLIALAQTLRDKREPGLDKELNQILDDIELRAEVELAKLSHSV